MLHGTGVEHENCGYREGSETSRGVEDGGIKAGADLGT